MNWLTVFAQRWMKLQQALIAAVSSSMQKIIPFILTGSVIYFYNVFRSYLPALPDLGMIADYSFGLISLILAFVVDSSVWKAESSVLPDQTAVSFPWQSSWCSSFREQMKQEIWSFRRSSGCYRYCCRYRSRTVYIHYLQSVFQAACTGGFHIHSGFRCRLDQLHTAYPDYAWSGYGLLTKYCNFDIFEIVLWIFSPLAGFARTCPVSYSAALFLLFVQYGYFSWQRLRLQHRSSFGYSGKYQYGGTGLLLRISRRGRRCLRRLLLPWAVYGGNACAECAHVLLKIKAAENTGKNLHRAKYFQHQWTNHVRCACCLQLLMLPMWLNFHRWTYRLYWWALDGWTFRQHWIRQDRCPVSTVMITQDMVFMAVVLFVVYFAIWYRSSRYLKNKS